MTPVAASVPSSGTRLPARTLGAYGLLGLPLAMAALPLYVHLPSYYGNDLGVPLATLGVLLFVLRLADGIVDPLLGAWCDRLPSRKLPIALATPVLAAGMVALFSPPSGGTAVIVTWLGVALAFVYGAFSLATIAHGAWGAELSPDPVERTRTTATRESLALVGVVIASLAPGVLAGDEAGGLQRFAWLFAGIVVVCAIVSLAFAPAAPTPRTPPQPGSRGVRADLVAPLRDRAFRRLLAAFVANGIAAAIPATLVLFFVADVLRAQAQQGVFLALYFVAAAAGLPLWVRVSARVGKVRAWYAAMILAVAAFVWAGTLGAGDTTAFAVICIVSGVALGADLALAPSILADVIGRGGRMHATGAYFGLWTLATKLNLAVAAGLGLTLTAAFGYAPGTQDPTALRALAWVYAGVPCLFKLVALVALARFERDRLAPS